MPVVPGPPVSLTGLIAGARYRARVRGSGAGGTGPWSGYVDWESNYVPGSGPVTATADFSTLRAGSAIATDVPFAGSCISTYDGDGQGVNLVKGTAAQRADWRGKLAALGPVGWRIPLAWNGGTPGSSAGGARSYGDAGAYVQAIKDIGGTPIVAIGGSTGDNDILAADAAALVRYFNDNGGQNGGPVTRWIIGNEPDNGGANAFGMAAYINGGKGSSGFNAIAAAMRAASTQTLNIAGPALVTYADYKQNDYNSFFDACGAQVDTIDFHAYDGGNIDTYTAGMTWFRAAIAARPSMAGRVKIHCGELNWHPSYVVPNADDEFYTSVNTVFMARAIGRIVEQGGRAYQYSDNNGPLGLITPGNGDNGAPVNQRLPMPAYYGLKMWTGGNLFRPPTGSMATCTSTHPMTEVFASAGNKNVVYVNHSETLNRAVELAIPGAPAAGTYEVWQTRKGMDSTDITGNQWKDPVLIASGSYTGGRISFVAPSMTVSTILVGV